MTAYTADLADHYAAIKAEIEGFKEMIRRVKKA